MTYEEWPFLSEEEFLKKQFESKIMKEGKKLQGINEVLNSLQLHVKTPKGKTNAFGRYKYRTAEDILLAVKEELKEENYPSDCIILTNVELKEILNRLFVCVTATLRVGKDEVSSQGLAEHAATKKGMDEAQLTGATITYARKYALQNLFGIDESEDDIDSKDNREVKQNVSHAKLANIVEESSNEMADLIESKKKEDELKKAQAQLFADNLKEEMRLCGSVAEVEAIWEKKQSLIERLKANYKSIFNDLSKAKTTICCEIDPSNFINAG